MEQELEEAEEEEPFKGLCALYRLRQGCLKGGGHQGSSSLWGVQSNLI
jgi:hypothetical protein